MQNTRRRFRHVVVVVPLIPTESSYSDIKIKGDQRTAVQGRIHAEVADRAVGRRTDGRTDGKKAAAAAAAGAFCLLLRV